MTIKQQGGVFGRNPTFNNVEVDGTATIDNIAASDKLRVTASDFPAAYIEFENIFQNAGVTSQAGLLLGVNSSVQTNYAGVIGTESAPNSNGVELDFYANNGSAMVHVARARGSKNFEIMDGNLIVASGHGIDFSATSGTGTSELFDDYEEGTWTPVVADAASGGNEATASSALGVYTKIGNVVVAQAYILSISSAGLTAGNDVYIRGFPFSSQTGSKIFTCSARMDNITFAGIPMIEMQAGVTSARILEVSSGSAVDRVTCAELGGGAGVFFNLVYHTA